MSIGILKKNANNLKKEGRGQEVPTLFPEDNTIYSMDGYFYSRCALYSV